MSNTKIIKNNNVKLSENQTKKIASLLQEGITFSFPNQETVLINQEKIISGKIFSNKQLHTLAREIFLESKIIPVVFSLNLDSVTTEWVTKQMRLYGINAKDLQRQLGFDKEAINDFLKLRTKLKPLEKAALFYYFLTFERI